MFDIIAFDADDTLWHNDHNFNNIQKRFYHMLGSEESLLAQNTLSDFHIRNIDIYGYGVKSFILSMIETYINLKGRKVRDDEIHQILNFGKEMLAVPIELIPNVFDVLKQLKKEYTLMVITKGDLFDQEKKILRSGLSNFFKKIEIVSDKNEETYKQILIRYKIDASNFLMVGNSMRSDIVPVVKIGANAVHIPYTSTWEHERHHQYLDSGSFYVLENIGLLPNFLKNRK